MSSWNHIIHASALCSKPVFTGLFTTAATMPGQQVQKYNRLVAEGFARNEAKVTVVSARPVTRLNCPRRFLKAERETDAGIDYRYLPILNLPILKNVLVFIYAFLYTLALCWKHPDSVVISDVLNVSVATGATLAARLAGKPTIGIVTDVPALIASNPRHPRIRFNDWLIRQYASYVFMTEAMDQRLNPKGKPSLVIEGLVDAEMAHYENTLAGKDAKRIVIYAGLLCKQYGVDRLVEGFIAANPHDAELHLFGSGDYVPELVALSQAHPNVRYFGTVTNDEVVAAEQRATLLVNPRPTTGEFTRYSFPSKNMEYMVSGTPVLTTLLPGMPEAYMPCIYAIETETVEGMALALKGVLSKSADELHRMGQRAREFVLREKNNQMQSCRILEMASAQVKGRKTAGLRPIGTETVGMGNGSQGTGGLEKAGILGWSIDVLVVVSVLMYWCGLFYQTFSRTFTGLGFYAFFLAMSALIVIKLPTRSLMTPQTTWFAIWAVQYFVLYQFLLPNINVNRYLGIPIAVPALQLLQNAFIVLISLYAVRNARLSRPILLALVVSMMFNIPYTLRAIREDHSVAKAMATGDPSHYSGATLVGVVGYSVVYGLVLLTPAVMQLISATTVIKKLIYLSSALVVTYFLYKTSYFLTLVMLALGIVLHFFLKLNLKLKLAIIASLAITAIFFAFNPRLVYDLLMSMADRIAVQNISVRFRQIAAFIVSGEKGDTLLRLDLYMKSVRAFLANPLTGTAVFGRQPDLSGHSSFLDLLGSGGILHAAPYFAFLYYSYTKALAMSGRKETRNAVKGSYLLYLALGFTNTVFSTAAIMMSMLIILPALVYEIERERARSRVTRSALAPSEAADWSAPS